jgi:hypothetical protein
MRNASFVRKLIYIACIVLLLIPLSIIARPETASRDELAKKSATSGMLAEMRSDYRLSQTSLGDIDPASESMKLATLGLRPFAVSMLWNQVDEYKKTRNWDRLTATLNQLMKIQPNFIRVWEYQAHTLAYNTSREFDDYEDRYYWVKKGINFLISGIAYNRKNHKMIDNIAYVFSLKFGQSDETVQFRRLLRKDTDFHEELRKQGIDVDNADKGQGPDNYLIAKEWYDRSRRMVDDEKLPLFGSPIIFYMNSPKQTRNYAKEYEKEFEPGQKAVRAWQVAAEDWHAFGDLQLRSATGPLVVLNDEQKIADRIIESRAKLDALVGGARERLKTEAMAQRTAEETEIVGREGLGSLSPRETEIASQVRRREEISETDIIESREFLQLSDEKRAEGDRIYGDLARDLLVLDLIGKYRGLANYSYWEVRNEAEQLPEAIEARKGLFRGYQKRFDQPIADFKKDPVTGDFVLDKNGKKVLVPGAKDEFESSFKNWAIVFKKYPPDPKKQFRLDAETLNDDLEEAMTVYLGMLGGPAEWPTDFPLQYLVDQFLPDGHVIPKTEQLMQLHPDVYRDRKIGIDGSFLDKVTPKVTDPQSPETEKPNTEEPKTEQPKTEETKSKGPESGTSPDAPAKGDAAKDETKEQPKTEDGADSAADDSAAEVPASDASDNNQKAAEVSSAEETPAEEAPAE